MAIGPIQAFVIGFPDNDKFEGRIVEELGRFESARSLTQSWAFRNAAATSMLG